MAPIATSIAAPRDLATKHHCYFIQAISALCPQAYASYGSRCHFNPQLGGKKPAGDHPKLVELLGNKVLIGDSNATCSCDTNDYAIYQRMSRRMLTKATM